MMTSSCQIMSTLGQLMSSYVVTYVELWVIHVSPLRDGKTLVDPRRGLTHPPPLP